MSVEDNKHVLQAFVAAVNKRDWERVRCLVTADVVRHGSGPGQVRGTGRDSLVAFLRAEAEAFPDSQESILFMVAEGDRVAARMNFRGTQLGWSGPYPPVGKVLDANFLGIFRMEQGLIAETWVEFDNLQSLAQLGHYQTPQVPSPNKE